MPVARERKAQPSRCPAWERAGPRPPIRIVRHAENSGGVEAVVADAGRSDRPRGLRIEFAADRDERRRAPIAVIAPIERRVNVEEREPAHQEQRETEEIDPVRQPHDDCVPVHDFALCRNFDGGIVPAYSAFARLKPSASSQRVQRAEG